mmetsp:Transcript_18715/g.29485  ORF Transcript_18715/g.29485 Transcript_18715/m.29485 type:complete len:282 (+) Transcript_18715:44-889(+)
MAKRKKPGICKEEGKVEPNASETHESASVRSHERVRKDTKLLKSINWSRDSYKLCIEKRREEQSGSLFIVFILDESSSGKKFSCAISDEEQENLLLNEGTPPDLAVMDNLFQFMEDAFKPGKPEFSISLPEFLDSTMFSVSLDISYENALGGWSAVQFKVQVDLAMFHNPSEAELMKMLMEKRVVALEEKAAKDSEVLRQEVSSLRVVVQQLQTQLREERAAANAFKQLCFSAFKFHSCNQPGYGISAHVTGHKENCAVLKQLQQSVLPTSSIGTTTLLKR